MHVVEAIGEQPEYSSVLYQDRDLTLQKTVVVEEERLEAELEGIPWDKLVYFRCDRLKGGKRQLLFRWKAGQEGWELSM